MIQLSVFAFGLAGIFAAAPQALAEGKSANKFFEFSMNSIDGVPVAMSNYKDKVVLVVNVASRCGFTKQYEGLEALNKKYRAKGLAILGFPSNDFMGQEPGTAKEIKAFCQTKYGVSFDLFEKIRVKGKDAHPLYQVLAEASTGEGRGAPGWNFHKYLITRKGEIIGYKSSTTPAELDSVIAAQL